MEKILVTGATGELGRLSIHALLKRTTAAQLAALARDPVKAADIKELGVEVRQGDYADPASLERAMQGIDRLLMISTTMFTDTIAHHRNVVAAARKAGVRHIVYTGIQRRAESGFSIDMVTETDLATERALDESGLSWTIMRNSLYLDSLPLIFGPNVAETGIRAPAGNGSAALGAKADFAEANAVVLTTPGHEGRIHTLGASTASTVADMADTLGDAVGHPVSYISVDRREFIDARSAEGLPLPVADFLAQWAEAIAAGEFAEVTGDLERLIGRRPLDQGGFLRALYSKGETSPADR